MTSARSATTSGSEPLLDRGNRSDGAPLGGRVARLLSERGEQIRLTVREPARAPQLDGAEIAVAAGCHDTDEMSAALMGADTVFLVSGRESPNRLDEHKSAVDAVARSRCARDRGADSRRSGPSVCGLVPSRRLVPAMREEVAAATRWRHCGPRTADRAGPPSLVAAVHARGSRSGTAADRDGEPGGPPRRADRRGLNAAVRAVAPGAGPAPAAGCRAAGLPGCGAARQGRRLRRRGRRLPRRRGLTARPRSARQPTRSASARRGAAWSPVRLHARAPAGRWGSPIGSSMTAQIAERIRSAIESGALGPGDKLPSTRALAEQAAGCSRRRWRLAARGLARPAAQLRQAACGRHPRGPAAVLGALGERVVVRRRRAQTQKTTGHAAIL